MASDYKRLGTKFDIVAFAQAYKVENRPYANLSVVDERGDVILRSTPLTEPENFRNAESFKFHAAQQSKSLYVSKPMNGATAGKWIFDLSRRIDKADGSFGGMVSIGMDPEYFAAFYKQLDLGANAVVSLIGKDGIVRARQLGGKFDAGFDAGKSPLFTDKLPVADSGTYIGASPADGIDKIFAYCALKEYPLVVLVGSSRAALLTAHQQRWAPYFGAAGGISLVVLFFLALAMQQIARRERANRELIQSEISLRASEERLRAIIDTEPECVKVVAPDGKLVEMNAAGLRMLQADSLAAIADKPLLDFVLPDYLEAFGELLQKVMRGESATLEFKIAGLKGRQRWLDTHAAPLCDPDGRVTALLGVTRDITERKQAEEAVRASEQSIRRLYEITNAAELSFDERVRALLAFGCARFGLPNGLVTQAAGDELEVRYSHSPDGCFAEGMKIPRSAAYCTSVMAAGEPLCYENVGQSVWLPRPGHGMLHGD